MLSNRGKFRDRNPETIPAGKLFSHGDTAKTSMKYPQKLQVPDQIKKFRCTTQPAAGRERIFYGRYNDPDVASTLSHGVHSKPSLLAGQLIHPRPQSYFRYRVNEKRENEVYASKQKGPLGKSYDQRKVLPIGMEPYDTRFGIKVIKDISAGELVNPCKDPKQVQDEASEGLDLYKKSHSAYEVGEMYNRKYDWSRVPEANSFGIETPHDNRGLNTKKTLKWMYETMSDKATPVTSKQVDDFRERDIPQVGTVHDPIKDMLDLDPNHVFGILHKPDKYGAGDLIHMRNAGYFVRGKERQRGLTAAIRQDLKNANYQNFDDLKMAFNFYDKDKSGTIDVEELRKVCQHFRLPVREDLMVMLLDYVDVDDNKSIDYVEFVNFLNWKDNIPNTFKRIKRQGVDGSQKTTADEEEARLPSQVDDTTRNDAVTNTRKYGIPTIRSDLPAPMIRRIGDNTNYGDESDSYGLMNPSIYSNHGVYEQDFFQKRQQGEIRRICDSIGVEMTNEVFQDIWNKAYQSSGNNEVSVETFRNVLDEQVAEEYQKMAAQEENGPNNLGSLIKKLTTEKPSFYSTIQSKPDKSKELIDVS